MRRIHALWVFVPLSGCFYPADRGRALEVKVEQLASDNARLTVELQQAREDLAATLVRADRKIAEVTKALEGLDTAARRNDADIGVQLQKAIEDIAQLRGQVETYVYKIGELEAALARTTEESERRFLQLQGQEAQKAAEARRKAEELQRPTDKKEFLALADSKAKARELGVARQLYAEFLKKWPKDPLAGEAHYGLGETYFAEDRCREALFEYGKVIQEHAKARSAPEAFLRSSDCFRKLKMQDEARLALEELIRSYPKSAAAKTARTRLAELGKTKKQARAPAKKEPAAKKEKK